MWLASTVTREWKNTEPASTYSLTSADLSFRPILADYVPIFPRLQPHAYPSLRRSPPNVNGRERPTSARRSDSPTMGVFSPYPPWRYCDYLMIILIAMWIEEQTNKSSIRRKPLPAQVTQRLSQIRPPQSGQFSRTRLGGGKVHFHSLFCDVRRACAVFQGFSSGLAFVSPFRFFPQYHHVVPHASLSTIHLYYRFSCAKRARSKEATG